MEDMNAKNFMVRSISLYYQTDAETGGNAGWAYNVIDSEGEHTSDGIETIHGNGPDGSDDGSEPLSAVREAFALAWPEAAAQVSSYDAMPEGGWIARR